MLLEIYMARFTHEDPNTWLGESARVRVPRTMRTLLRIGGLETHQLKRANLKGS